MWDMKQHSHFHVLSSGMSEKARVSFAATCSLIRIPSRNSWHELGLGTSPKLSCGNPYKDFYASAVATEPSALTQ